MTPVDKFVATEVALANDPEAVLTTEALRQAFVAWCSDRRIRPGTGAGMGKAITALGGRRKIKPEVHYLGVEVAPIADSGYRSRTRAALAGPPAVDPMPGLIALAEAGILTDSRALDVAWLRLSRHPGAVTCRTCGVITRHTEEGKHVGC